jgi:hypothetical protein
MRSTQLLQWPAMALTVVSVWWIASSSRSRRALGFWSSLAGSLLWILWGYADGAWALIVMQICLVLLNIRGAVKNRT